MNKEEKITISVNEEDIQNIINAYEKDIEYINQLEKENKELKRKLNEAIHKATEFESEVYELKKQLEEKENIACNWKDSCLENAGKIEELENQQKEFIEYLEKTIVDSKAGSGQQYYFQVILSKYKEIIGE